MQKLAAKGYSVTEIKSTIQALSESGEIDFKKNAATLAKKKGVMPEGEEMKILLYKNGY